MRCIYVDPFSSSDLEGLKVGDLSPRYPAAQAAADPDPTAWVRVRLRAASLNRHDLWSLRGVGLPESALPMVLGTDAAGTTEDGRDGIVHCVSAPSTRAGPATRDPEHAR